MFRITGEYQATIDDKGRMKLPAGLIKQFTEQGVALNFTLNRGFDKCLMLYPKTVWDKKASEVDTLNIYHPEQRQFLRYFYRGATNTIADAADRLLIPKSLADHAGLQKEIVLFAYLNQVELWDAQTYYNELAKEPTNFSDLAEKVFGRNPLAQSSIQTA